VLFKLIDQPGTFCAYGHTRRRTPFNPHRGAPITNGYCAHPLPIQQQRGAANAPRPPGDDTWHAAYTTGAK
jgi:hypothetical protein